MNLYLAPLEGITGHIYRNALHQCFDGFDKYFIPFISPNQKGHFSTREKKDVMPEHNQGMYAVPQILTNNVEDFLCTAQKLGDYGYKEVNLNLGCPSRTVVTKGRGAGFLDEPQKLDRFLDAVFEKCNLEISIKTRIGMEDPEEFETILPIYNKYLLGEIAGKKVLGVFSGIFTLVMIGTGAYCYRTLTMDRLIFGTFLVSAILGFILDLVIAYRLYKNVVPKWKDVLLLLSILSGGLLRPVILFGLRKKVTETDKKMG